MGGKTEWNVWLVGRQVACVEHDGLEKLRRMHHEASKHTQGKQVPGKHMVHGNWRQASESLHVADRRLHVRQQWQLEAPHQRLFKMVHRREYFYFNENPLKLTEEIEKS